jgi:F-type H+-transporting ATPase subunit b
MNTSSLFKRLLLVVLLVIGMALASSAYAQEATPAGEPAAQAEGEAAAETEAAEEEAPATNPLTPLGINTGFLVAQILNFLVILLLVSTLLWRPMMNMLDSRAAKIQKGLEDAAAAANARRNAEVEAEKIRSEARADVQRMMEEARGRGEEVRKGVIDEANKDAEKIRAEAQVQASESLTRQAAELRSQVATISIAVAQQLIGANLDEQRQRALVNDFFAKLPDQARGMGGSIEVVSALPLNSDEQARIKSETGASDAKFESDPSILGGLIIRAEGRVVDASVRSNLNTLAGRLR